MQKLAMNQIRCTGINGFDWVAKLQQDFTDTLARHDRQRRQFGGVAQEQQMADLVECRFKPAEFLGIIRRAKLVVPVFGVIHNQHTAASQSQNAARTRGNRWRKRPQVARGNRQTLGIRFGELDP